MSGSFRGGSHATPARILAKRAAGAEKAKAEGVEVETAAPMHSPFHEMTVAELRVWAQKYDVPRYAKLKKSVLADAVRDAFAASPR